MAAVQARTEEHRTVKPKAGPAPARSWAALGLLWLACIYLWVVPLLAPRGYWFWGRYKTRDLLLGVPLGLFTLWATAVLVSPASQRRQVGLRVASVILATLLGIALFDVTYVVTHPRGMLQPYNVPDAQLGFKRKPLLNWHDDRHMGVPKQDLVYYARNWVWRTDENGFRNPLGIRRADIVFIGDSFTESFETQEASTFVQRVGAQSGLKVVNLGLGNIGPQAELIILKRWGLAYKPRYVVWQIFGGNDLQDAEDFYRLSAKADRSLRRSLGYLYLRRSAVWNLLQNTLPPPPPEDYATLHETGGATTQVNVAHANSCYAPDLPAQHRLGWKETKRTIEEGYQLCRSRGIQLVVLFCPTREQVLAESIEFHSKAMQKKALPRGIWSDPRDFGHRLGAFCRQIGCPFVDALPALRARAAVDNRHVYFPMNHHLDVDGHAVVAQLLMDWLRSRPNSPVHQGPSPTRVG